MTESTVALKVCKVSKEFSNHLGVTKVLSDINFELIKGEVIGIRGENGSGKTTLFNIIAGIETQTLGDISYYKSEDNLKTRINVVFQNYNSTLLPWLNIKKNICIPLKLAGIPKFERNRRLLDVLGRLKFSTLPLKNYPHQISGGQKQKVAIARALIQRPDILILDEPFSNLDNSTSIELQDILQEIHFQHDTSILLVSHNLDHVLYLSDRILILGGHPATIVKEFTIPFRRKRKRELIVSNEFEDYRNKILEYEYDTIC